MNITEKQLQQIFPNAREQAGVFVSVTEKSPLISMLSRLFVHWRVDS
ncbi:hypothetical protein [Pseudomonas sp. 31 E 6]|nr:MULTISPECIES: hypothetical protein [Pseudomonas]CRM16049.1 hypothetical protein [Pseudomonas sp. 31 E 5]CRM25633.1 hypothetical protein [Pseudomonas sp. 31 E 6]